MTRNQGILTLALSLLFTGCASDNMTWRDANTSGANRSTDYTNNMTSRGTLPDNPQVPAVNDKTRSMTFVLNDADIAFVRNAQAGGMYEISAGEKALLKSSNPDIKNIAQHMVDDHSKAGNQLKNLASRKGLPDNAMLTPALVDQLAQLDKLSGTEFDREYIRQQRAAHLDTVAKFETASSSASDNDLREWATATLPTLRQHKTMVDDQARIILGDNN